MTLQKKLKSLFTEGIGGIGGFVPHSETTPRIIQSEDRKRKKIERQGEQRLNKIKKSKEDEEQIDPRTLQQGHFRLTLLETFLHHVIKYLDEGNYSDILECCNLMEEYPKLKAFVIEKSKSSLPKNEFSIYHARQSLLDEEIGSNLGRTGDHPHKWCLSSSGARQNAEHLDEASIIECKISPDNTLIYIPAFTDVMEKLILSGKLLAEPKNNVLRKAKQMNEIILPPHINEGVIIKKD